MKYTHYFLIGVIALILLVVGYEKYAVIKCTNKSAEAASSPEQLELLERQRLYDIVYTACMGRKGFER